MHNTNVEDTYDAALESENQQIRDAIRRLHVAHMYPPL